jgi:four helix bundle protein
MQPYRQLDVWHRAHRFRIQVDRLAVTFPRGHARFVDQLVRSAESIPTNIVEGAAAATRKEFARFLDISVKSTAECQYHLEAGRDRGHIAPKTWARFEREVIEIRRMLCGLRRTILLADHLAQQPKKKTGPANQLPTDNRQLGDSSSE